jgi:hypothetical protein
VDGRHGLPGRLLPDRHGRTDCYWLITKSGTNGSEIVDNDAGGGHLTVTLKVGHDFETQPCGTWTKI